ncbi:MAG: hypothetical protein QGH33_18100 [Pirellulaceae bacterium]|jgi:hypothetical protein|nr:hypothetical protein [Pirellulaceae bacterium]HJN64881.1 hypothetical protein [Pirellulales bacterium]
MTPSRYQVKNRIVVEKNPASETQLVTDELIERIIRELEFQRTTVVKNISINLLALILFSVSSLSVAADQQRPTSESPPLPASPTDWKELLTYAFTYEKNAFLKIDRTDPLERVLDQTQQMIARLATKGLDVSKERDELAEFRKAHAAHKTANQANLGDPDKLFFEARLAKRRLMMRDPALASLEKILFVKRQPFEPSHNYSVILDGKFRGGGGVCVLNLPRRHGRLEVTEGKLDVLFDARGGMVRDPMANFDATQVYFSFRPTEKDHWHIYVMDTDGSGVRQLTTGPFHDYYPCPLPDGGVAFISTRCKGRFLCWRPQAFVMFRMEADGSKIQPLSYANLSEWAPSVMRDGRIIWTRSEYIDKGADFGHTLWAMRPDGTHPTLIFGNNTINCYANGREVPGTQEICSTLISHGGDLNGPIALIDVSKGRSNPESIKNITPDVQFHTHMSWARKECFRDPVPVSRDYFLVSHAPADKFGLYVIDRYGNREVLYLDPAVGSMCPTLLRQVPTPPVLRSTIDPDLAEEHLGQFIVLDVYQGLRPHVKHGEVKYLRVCQEVRADLIQLADGTYQNDHRSYLDWYATPIHKVRGPHGWPSYVAKATWGTVPVETDGSANFLAPAGKVLYFQALDKDFNEVQRMRSVVQLQSGEKRSCIGCHENRVSAASVQNGIATGRAPSRLQPPPWGAGPFSYEKIVQPVWDAKCVDCHDSGDKHKINLTGTLDHDKVPASYRTLVSGGWVHYVDCNYGEEHTKADPKTFGTLKSKLWQVLDEGHHKVKLTSDEMRRVKCWIDLNCPLWPDYVYRDKRPGNEK